MAEVAQKLSWMVQVSQFNLHYILWLMALLWIIQIINFVCAYRLNHFGILPRTSMGLLGIIFSPFLHASFSHLLFNSIPLFLLMNLILLTGLSNFILVSFFIMLIGGFCVWLLGRPAAHVGASGMIMGYWGYLIIDAILFPSITTVLLIIFCFYYFAGLFSSLLPKAGSSWESHFFGFLVGIGVSYTHLPAYFLHL